MIPKRIPALLILLPVMLNIITCTGFGNETLAHISAGSSGAASIVLGSIQVGNNDTYIIENGNYVLNDSITISQNATLIIRNAVVNFNATSSSVLYANDNATVSIFNATVSHVLGYYYAYFHGKATSNITDSSLLGSSYLYFYDTSNSTFANSEADVFYAYNNATVTMSDTRVQSIYGYSLSKVSILRCLIFYLYAYDSTSVSLADSTVSDVISMKFQSNSSLGLSLPRGVVNNWNLYNSNSVTKAYFNLTIANTRVYSWDVFVYGTSAVSIADSSLDSLVAYDNSTVSLDNCTVNSMNVNGYSNVMLIDSAVISNVYLDFSAGSTLSLTMQTGHFAYWNLYVNNTVVTAYLNLTMQNSNVTGWNIDSYNSEISWTGSNLGSLGLYDNSSVSVVDSSVNYLYGSSFSSATITSANVNSLYTYDSSTVNATASAFYYMYAYGNSSIWASQIRTEYLGVGEYASLVIRDSLVTYEIYLSFSADSDVSLNSLPVGRIPYWNLYDNATVVKAYLNLTMINTSIRGWNEIDAYDESSISVSNSIVDYFYCYYLSQVTVANSLIDSVYLYDNSSLIVTTSSIRAVQFDFGSDSNVSLTSLPTGMVDFWNLYENCTVGKAYLNFTVSHSWVSDWGFYAYDSATLSYKRCVLDSVYAYGSSKVSMDNCTVSYFGAYDRTAGSLARTVVQYGLYIYDDSTLTITDSNLQSRLYVKFKPDSEVYDLSPPVGHVTTWNLYKNSTVQRAYLNLTISNTAVNSWGFYVYGSSTISFVNSSIGYLSANDFSTVSMEDCTVENLYAYRLSQLFVTSIPSGTSVVTYLYTYGISTATLTESKVAITYAYQYSAVNLTGSDYAVVRVYDLATVQTSRFLGVHVLDQASNNVASANVTVEDANGTLVYSTQTNSDGWANFTLAEEAIDALGSHPAGNYTVTGTYAAYNASRNLAMTKNQLVTISLAVIIPEFPVALMIPMLLILLTAFAVVLKKPKRSSKAQIKSE
jgi:hypothetical protein